jgi:hypothetical protein
VEEQTRNNSVGDVFQIMEQDWSVKKLPSVLEHTKSPLHIFPGSFLPLCVLLFFPGCDRSITNCNGTGALGQEQQEQLQWHWGTGATAIAIAMGGTPTLTLTPTLSSATQNVNNSGC